MLGIVLIAAVGVFAMGITVGIVAVVSYGIRREQKRFRQGRHYRNEHGIPGGPDWPEYFLAMEALGAASQAARRLNGLYIRRLSEANRDDSDTDLGVPV